MDYLGLGPDDAYDDYDASVAVERPRSRPGRVSRPAAVDEFEYEEEEYDDYEEPVRQPRRPVGRDDSSVTVRPSNRPGSNVKSLGATMEPTTIRPERYNEAREIADLVKSGQPVLMDIGSAEEPTARRLLDFVSGLVYGSEGSLEKVAPGVFLIKPRGVRVTRN